MVLNLQNKLIMFTAGLIVLIALFFSTYLINHESTLLLNALEKRGETIANGIANNCQFSILAEDRTSLGNFVDSAMKEKDVATASVINKDGRFLSHSETNKIDRTVETDIEKKALELKEASFQKPDSKTIVISVPVTSKVTQSAVSSGGSDLESMMGLGAGQSDRSGTSEIKKETIGAVQISMKTTGISDELRKIKYLIFLFTLIIILIGIALIIMASRITLNPLKQVIHKIQKISQGEIEEELQIKSNDEIGDLGRAFNQMVKYIEEIAKNANLVAQGELNTEITPRSDQDVLGNAFKEMVVYLQEMAELAQNISQGNISGNIHPRSDKDILGVAFKEMVSYFQEMSQMAQEISQGNISGNIRVRSQFDVLGTSFKQIVEYLQEMANITQDVSRGNLTTAIKPRSSKDLIGNALSSMITGLRDLISQIQESSNQIHSRANEMASLSRTSSEAISQMASNVSQISVSITKISDTTQTIATVAQKSAKTAETGDENISGVIAKVSHSKDSAYQSAELIKNLGKRSMQIGEIINYITKVADQTNLLSLNAAIEAARAGEAGRGFAVVADEVRKLAEGSAQSASEIARLISEVQAETAKAVTAVEIVAKDVGESANVTTDAGKSFKDISQAAKNIAGQIEDIAASSEETAASAEEASASSEEQVATFEEISTSIENLKEIAESLKDSASKFKLS